MGRAHSFVWSDVGLWVGGPGPTYQLIDPDTGTVVQEVTLQGRPDADLPVSVIAFEAVWVADFDAAVVYRHDLDTGERVKTVKVGAGPDNLFAAHGSLWVANHHGGSVSRIDPRTDEVVASVEVRYAGTGGAAGMTAGDGRVWVAVPLPGSVAAIDVKTNKAADAVDVQTTPCGVTFVATRYWVNPCEGSWRADPEVFDVGMTKAEPVEIRGRLIGTLGTARTWWHEVDDPGTGGHFVARDPQTLEVVDSVAFADPVNDLREYDGDLWLLVGDAAVRVPSKAFLTR